MTTRGRSAAPANHSRASGREGAGRLLRALADADRRGAASEDSPSPTESWLPAQVWLPSVEVVLVRESAGSAAGLTLAIKGGHNDEHHNHNDVGSFVVASDGVPVLVDPGRPTYTKQTFGPGRYDIWTMQSQWHSVPVVGGAGQSAGARFAACDVDVRTADAGMSLDLAGAYDVPGVESFVRSARLDRTLRRVELHDRWSVAAGTSVVEHLIVAGDVELVPGGARVRPLAGATPVRLRWSAGLDARLERRPLEDPMLASVWGTHLTRIRIDVGAHDGFTLTVERDHEIAEDDE